MIGLSVRVTSKCFSEVRRGVIAPQVCRKPLKQTHFETYHYYNAEEYSTKNEAMWRNKVLRDYNMARQVSSGPAHTCLHMPAHACSCLHMPAHARPPARSPARPPACPLARTHPCVCERAAHAHAHGERCGYRQDFATEREYNDYLEDVEDIV